MPRPKIIDRRHSWPFPLPASCLVGRGEDWAEVVAASADEMRDCLPPYFVPHGFFVGEAADHDPRDGCPVHTLVVQTGGRWFMRDCRRTEPDRQHAFLQLLQALHGAPDVIECRACGCAKGEGGHGKNPGGACDCVKVAEVAA